MSDVDAFPSEEQQGEVDPAADFLSREQDQLAEIGENFEFVQGEGAATDEVAEQPSQQSADIDFFSAEPESAPAQEPFTNGEYSGLSAIAQADAFGQEPEKIKIWREEQAERLRVKDEEEVVKVAELKGNAQKELEEWYAKREEQLNKTKENNQAAEESFVKERDETAPGSEWQKIGRMCEFNPKGSKNTKDVSRMRSILLQLKQSPPVKAATA